MCKQNYVLSVEYETWAEAATKARSTTQTKNLILTSLEIADTTNRVREHAI